MRRRALLLGTVGAAGCFVSGCRSSQVNNLQVEFLDRTIPSQILKSFRKQVQPNTRIAFEAAKQQLDIYTRLQQWKAQEPVTSQYQNWLKSWFGISPSVPRVPDLVTLGDYWLPAAIQQGLIEPITVDNIPQWKNLPAPWRSSVTRNEAGQLDSTGAVWGAPYRVQSLMLVYQHRLLKQFDWQPMSWSDLWRPELKGRIAIPNHPRLAISLVLKGLGYSVNDESKLSSPAVQDQLQALYNQVRMFDSATYLKALINEDIWLAVGWSGDILSTLTRYRRLNALFPSEGTLLTSDLWVKPKLSTTSTHDPASGHTALGASWIDFCWQSSVATQISMASQGLSPIFLGGTPLPESLSNQPNRFPSPDILTHSELLYPLSKSGQSALAETINQLTADSI